MAIANSSTDIRYLRLTARGRGAIAVVCVFGDPHAIAAKLDSVFIPVHGKSLNQLIRRPMIYGLWHSNSDTKEDLVVCPKNDRVEIQCHGGEAAVRAVCDTLESLGIIAANVGEIASLNGESEWKSEIREAMSKAPTLRGAEFLLQNFQTIAVFLSDLERLIQSDIAGAISEVAQVLGWATFGKHLVEPRSVVLCGEPNVGKSSLINAVVGFDRAIVHETAGTTRDVVTQQCALDGWPFELKDTAGIRDSEQTIERLGIKKAEHEIATADLVLAVYDVSGSQPEMEISAKSIIYVGNKCDLLSSDASRPRLGDDEVCYTSAATGEGVEQLIDRIVGELVNEIPPLNQIVPVSETQIQIWDEVLAHLKKGNGSAATSALTR